MEPRAGFLEREHTADWELEVWAPDFLSLLEQAARGMYAISGTRLKAGPSLSRHFILSGSDREMLLVRFLGELLYLGEQENLGFVSFDLVEVGQGLSVEAHGAPIDRLGKLIKAVTYHNLAIYQTARGLEVSIVFDV